MRHHARRSPVFLSVLLLAAAPLQPAAVQAKPGSKSPRTRSRPAPPTARPQTKDTAPKSRASKKKGDAAKRRASKALTRSRKQAFLLRVAVENYDLREPIALTPRAPWRDDHTFLNVMKGRDGRLVFEPAASPAGQYHLSTPLVTTGIETLNYVRVRFRAARDTPYLIDCNTPLEPGHEGAIDVLERPCNSGHSTGPCTKALPRATGTANYESGHLLRLVPASSTTRTVDALVVNRTGPLNFFGCEITPLQSMG